MKMTFDNEDAIRAFNLLLNTLVSGNARVLTLAAHPRKNQFIIEFELEQPNKPAPPAPAQPGDEPAHLTAIKERLARAKTGGGKVNLVD